MILLCILSQRYPFFRAQDDQTALAQIISLMGSKECTKAATACGEILHLYRYDIQIPVHTCHNRFK